MVQGEPCPRSGDGDGQGRGEPADAAERTVDSRCLFGAGRMLTIRHGAEHYTLRITRADKLILTK